MDADVVGESVIVGVCGAQVQLSLSGHSLRRRPTDLGMRKFELQVGEISESFSSKALRDAPRAWQSRES